MLQWVNRYVLCVVPVLFCLFYKVMYDISKPQLLSPKPQQRRTGPSNMLAKGIDTTLETLREVPENSVEEDAYQDHHITTAAMTTKMTQPIKLKANHSSESSTIHEDSMPEMLDSRQRWVIAIHDDPNGPNCQYDAFKGLIKYAIMENRTVVEMWFVSHGSSGKEYARQTKFLNTTFDVDKIKEVVPIISVEEFRFKCNSTVDTIIMNYPKETPKLSKDDFIKQYRLRTSRFSSRYGITLPGIEAIPQTPEAVEERNQTARHVRCLALFEPERMTRIRAPRDVISLVERHLVRTPQMRHLADLVSHSICNGDPYIAMHWRNKSGETHYRNSSTIENVAKTAAVLAGDVKKFMVARNVSCLYVSFPPFSKYMTTVLEEVNIPNVVTVADITDASYPVKIPDEVRFDNYYTALLEQEIWIRSEVFLYGSSSMSFMARNYRKLANKESIYLMHFISWLPPDVYVKRKR